MTQFTASEVHRLSNRISRSNDEIADAQEALRAFADLLEAREKAGPVAFPKRITSVPYLGHNTTPNTRLVGFVIEPGHPWYGNGLTDPLFALENALAAHSDQAQPPAASVPGVSAQAHENAQAALAAQENPNG